MGYRDAVTSRTQRTTLLFRRVLELPAKIAADPSPKRVHDLRTTVRRVEVLLAQCGDAADAKFRRRLGKLRKAAGKVRDLDVQIDAAGALDGGVAGREKAALLRALEKIRARRLRKLNGQISKHTGKRFARRVREMRAQVARADDDEAATSQPDARRALDAFAAAARTPLTEANLHGFRLACKQARYLAEGGEDPLARRVVNELKAIQDAVGTWHDCVVLNASAERMVSGPGRAALLAVLRVRRRSLLANAQRVSSDVRDRLLTLRASLDENKIPPSRVRPPAAPVAVAG